MAQADICLGQHVSVISKLIGFATVIIVTCLLEERIVTGIRLFILHTQ